MTGSFVACYEVIRLARPCPCEATSRPGQSGERRAVVVSPSWPGSTGPPGPVQVSSGEKIERKRGYGGDKSAVPDRVTRSSRAMTVGGRCRKSFTRLPCGVRRHRPLSENDLVDSARWHPDRASQSVLGQPRRLDEVEQQDLPGRRVGNLVSGNRRFRHGRDLFASTQSRYATAAEPASVQPITPLPGQRARRRP